MLEHFRISSLYDKLERLYEISEFRCLIKIQVAPLEDFHYINQGNEGFIFIFKDHVKYCGEVVHALLEIKKYLRAYPKRIGSSRQCEHSQQGYCKEGCF
jgi:hypothetical protein